jgi:hypothetical protein
LKNSHDHNPSRESAEEGNFFFGHNPLKSPDSEKQKKANKSHFASFIWICFFGTRALVVETIRRIIHRRLYRPGE